MLRKKAQAPFPLAFQDDAAARLCRTVTARKIGAAVAAAAPPRCNNWHFYCLLMTGPTPWPGTCVGRILRFALTPFILNSREAQ